MSCLFTFFLLVVLLRLLYLVLYRINRTQSSVYHVLQELSSVCTFNPSSPTTGTSSSASLNPYLRLPSPSGTPSSSSSSSSSSSHLSERRGDEEDQQSSSSSSPWCSGTERWALSMESTVSGRSANARLHDALAVLLFMLKHWVVAGNENTSPLGASAASPSFISSKKTTSASLTEGDVNVGDGGEEGSDASRSKKEEGDEVYLSEEKERTLLNFLEICRYVLPGRNVKKELTKLIFFIHQNGSLGIPFPPGMLEAESSRIARDCQVSSSSDSREGDAGGDGNDAEKFDNPYSTLFRDTADTHMTSATTLGTTSQNATDGLGSGHPHPLPETPMKSIEERERESRREEGGGEEEQQFELGERRGGGE